MEAKFEELIEGFITNRIGISEEFLGLPLAAALQKNIHLLKNDSKMIVAGIGNSAVIDKDDKIRSDKTCWLDTNSKNSAELEFLDIIAEFIRHLNRTCYTGINACEFHYALYEPGTFYSRHKDQLRNDSNRKYSMVSYLNENWLESDMGQLVIHEQETTRHILPSNQKTVFFQSDVLEHEVAVSSRARLSVTGWLKRI